MHTLNSLFAEVLRAKRHQGGLKMWPCLQIDDDWLTQIRHETLSIATRREPSQVARPDHPTHWVRPYGQATQHSLLNPTGDTADYRNDFNSTNAGKFFTDTESPAISRFAACFAGRLHNFRLNTLQTASGLRAHEEPIVAEDRVCLRFHLPVFTNPGATLVLDGERFHFEPGIVYFFNKGCIHSAENQGDLPRFHLLWDLWLDDWVHEHLFNPTSSATPDPQLRRIPAERVRELSHSTPVDPEDYIQGTATGALLHRQPSGESTTLHYHADIVPTDESIALGPDWHTLEHWQGDTFRWVTQSSTLNLLAIADGTAQLSIDLEPGPGVAQLPLELSAEDSLGCELARFSIPGRTTITIPVPVHTGPRNLIRLRALNGGHAIPADPRILDFRVFRATCQ